MGLWLALRRSLLECLYPREGLIDQIHLLLQPLLILCSLSSGITSGLRRRHLLRVSNSLLLSLLQLFHLFNLLLVLLLELLILFIHGKVCTLDLIMSQERRVS